MPDRVCYAERRSTLLPGTVWRRSAAAGTARIRPDGCMDLIWDGERLLIAGPDTATATFTTDRPSELVAVRFDPGIAPLVLGCPAAELVDSRIDLDELPHPRQTGGLVDALRAAADPAAVLECHLAQRLATSGGAPRWIPAVAGLLRAGGPVAQVADRLGVTSRHLSRKSLQHFGYGPKTLQRILRMDRAVEMLRAGGELSVVAHACGYADYSHMFRDFRAITGEQPSAFHTRAA